MIVAGDCYLADLLTDAPKNYSGSPKWIAIRKVGKGHLERCVRETPFKAAQSLHDLMIQKYGIADTLEKFKLQ